MNISDEISKYDFLGYIPCKYDEKDTFLDYCKRREHAFYSALDGNFSPILDKKPIKATPIASIFHELNTVHNIYGYFPMHTLAFRTEDIKTNGMFCKQLYQDSFVSMIFVNEEQYNRRYPRNKETIVHELVHKARETIVRKGLNEKIADECYTTRAVEIYNPSVFYDLSECYQDKKKTLTAIIFGWFKKKEQEYLIDHHKYDIDMAEDFLAEVYGLKNAKAIIGRLEWRETRYISSLKYDEEALKNFIGRQRSFRWEIIKEKYT